MREQSEKNFLNKIIAEKQYTTLDQPLQSLPVKFKSTNSNDNSMEVAPDDIQNRNPNNHHTLPRPPMHPSSKGGT